MSRSKSAAPETIVIPRAALDQYVALQIAAQNATSIADAALKMLAASLGVVADEKTPWTIDLDRGLFIKGRAANATPVEAVLVRP